MIEAGQVYADRPTARNPNAASMRRVTLKERLPDGRWLGYSVPRLAEHGQHVRLSESTIAKHMVLVDGVTK